MITHIKLVGPLLIGNCNETILQSESVLEPQEESQTEAKTNNSKEKRGIKCRSF